MKEQIKNLKVLKLEEFYGQTLGEVRDYLEKTYPGQLPTLELRDYIYEHQDEMPIFFREQNWIWFYFFGTILRIQDGNAETPTLSWGGGVLRRDAYWLGRWNSNYRIVLLAAAKLPMNIENAIK